ncbi:MAG: cell wall hydrolase [Gammaproteobacteria bacterium]|nr:cell wall hydrolase [Gammaproteobacteria bacterium]
MRFIVLILVMIYANSAFASNPKPKKESKQLRCLALNVYFEARGEPTSGQLAVAMVTMNRVRSKRFPSSVCGVVWQKRQFSWTHDGKSDRPTDKKAWKRAQQIAKFVYFKYDSFRTLSNGALDLTKGALHYYAPKLADPYWAKSKNITRQIGGHLFLAENS